MELHMLKRILLLRLSLLFQHLPEINQRPIRLANKLECFDQSDQRLPTIYL